MATDTAEKPKTTRRRTPAAGGRARSGPRAVPDADKADADKAPGVNENPQQAFDEQVRDDPDLQALLVERGAARKNFLAAQKVYKAMAEKAVLGTWELKVDEVWRVGPYRLERKFIPDKTIEAHTREGKERLNISMPGEPKTEE